MKQLAIILLCALPLLPQPSGTVSDPDAYAVYNAVIPSDWLIANAHASELRIEGTTDADNPFIRQCLPTGPGLTPPWLEALNDFTEQSVAAKSLTAQFSLPVPYRLMPRTAIQGHFTSAGLGGWDAFYAEHPNAKGFLALSAVGFDKAHQHAIVYMAHSCGSLCGEGAFHFFERAGNDWQEVRLNVNRCVWVS